MWLSRAAASSGTGSAWLIELLPASRPLLVSRPLLPLLLESGLLLLGPLLGELLLAPLLRLPRPNSAAHASARSAKSADEKEDLM